MAIRKQDRTRQQIINAADELYEAFAGSAESRYEATTIDLIAERAGVSRRTFFNHFTGKADVLLLDLRTAIEDHIEAFDARPLDETPLVAAIRAMAEISTNFVSNPINGPAGSASGSAWPPQAQSMVADRRMGTEAC